MSEVTDLSDDDFENQFYNVVPAKPVVEAVVEDEPVEAQEEEETGDDTPATELEEAEAPEEDESEESDEPEEEEEKPEVKPEGKKPNKVQERINKLLERERLANERAEALERRITELESGREKVEAKPEAKLPAEAPSPNAMDENGDAVYPLGEFDPEYIAALTRFTIKAETDKAREERHREVEAEKYDAFQKQLGAEWLDKVAKYEEESPDIRDHIADLTTTFQTLPPQYGEYLAVTLMASEVGPQIMEYFSQNPTEAQRVVGLGPAGATLAIGRLEAKFSSSKQDEKRNKKVSAAKEPPSDATRGHGGKFAVRPDTDDQDAFEKVFFKK